MPFRSKKRRLKTVFLAAATATLFTFVGLIGSQSPASALRDASQVAGNDVKCVPRFAGTGSPVILGPSVYNIYSCNNVWGLESGEIFTFVEAGRCWEVGCDTGPIITTYDVNNAEEYVVGSLEADCVAPADFLPPTLIVGPECLAS